MYKSLTVFWFKSKILQVYILNTNKGSEKFIQFMLLSRPNIPGTFCLKIRFVAFVKKSYRFCPQSARVVRD